MIRDPVGAQHLASNSTVSFQSQYLYNTPLNSALPAAYPIETLEPTSRTGAYVMRFRSGEGALEARGLDRILRTPAHGTWAFS